MSSACLARAVLTAAALATLSQSADAHEFWLDIIDYTPKPGAAVPIVHRVGQNFLGDSYPFLRKETRRFSVVYRRDERPIKAVDGDDPAGEAIFRQPGLAAVVYQGAPEAIVFDSFERFEHSVRYEGHDALADEHRRSGKPLTGIRESYTRFAKALVQVGGPAAGGEDRTVGLAIELVVERNPYVFPDGDRLPVRLLYRGRPLAGILVKRFHRGDPASPVGARTDADGRVSFELPYRGEYLLSAVQMFAAEPKDNADWVSLWASTTFARP